MKMKKPILTSSLSFAKSICGNAALYFDPYDAKDIAEKIIKLFTESNLATDLIDKGTKRLKEFDAPEIRAKKYLQICEDILTKNSNNKE
jgi:hypothetical protein